MSATADRPHVVIIGGFLTESLQYRPMRQRLLEAGARRVTIAPIHLPDWAVMGLVGLGPLLLRGARAIREARRASSEPVIVIGHSMGGLIARLATCEVPLDGRVAHVADDVGCLVTLGTPHAFEPRMGWSHAGVRAAEHLARHCPGAFQSPRSGYLTVGSDFVKPGHRASRRAPLHWFNALLRDLVGETPGIGSDGLVDAQRCRLAGARHVELDDILHGTVYGPWYGDTIAIDRWWPAAVEEWERALATRG